jgi:hypothetical protein
MQINPPTWRLNLPCPCCGQGQPVLVACRNCGRLAAECHELGTFFRDPWQLKPAESTECAGCGASGDDSFALATSDQIQSAGFKHGQYN